MLKSSLQALFNDSTLVSFGSISNKLYPIQFNFNRDWGRLGVWCMGHTYSTHTNGVVLGPHTNFGVVWGLIICEINGATGYIPRIIGVDKRLTPNPNLRHHVP